MKNLEMEIADIKSLLNEVLHALSSVNEQNFDENLIKAKHGMEKMANLRLSLKKAYPLEVLKKYDPELVEITKLIQDSFDNLFTKKKNQFAELGKQIAALRNKSKLVNYYR